MTVAYYMFFVKVDSLRQVGAAATGEGIPTRGRLVGVCRDHATRNATQEGGDAPHPSSPTARGTHRYDHSVIA